MITSIIASIRYVPSRQEVPRRVRTRFPRSVKIEVCSTVVSKDVVKFSAEIYKLGINPVVDPTEKALAAIFKQSGRSKGPIAVRGKLNGADFVQTLVKYKGNWRLYVNSEMLRAAGLNVGDTAHFQIEFDPIERTVAFPPKFRRALDSDPRAAEAFDSLPPGRKKEILRYLGSLKSDAAVERNIERVLSQLGN
jgi:hypothetical protein